MAKMKNIGTLLALFFLFPVVGLAADNDCYATFYQTKNTQCVDSLVESLESSVSANPSAGDSQAAVGFLAELFRAYPQEKERVLHMKTSARTKSIFIAALYRAGLKEEAKEYAGKNDGAEVFGRYQESNAPALKQIKPVSMPGDNDLMIGAYMASGDAGYIKRILENFSAASDGMVSDALRLSLMQAKFGPGMGPPGREKTLMLTACEKYQCKANMNDLMRIMTLSSAFWALQSLSLKDEGIKKTFIDFFESDPRLKRLVFQEENAFANYMTTLMAYAAIKDNAGINSSLHLYETLRPEEEVMKAMPKKN